MEGLMSRWMDIWIVCGCMDELMSRWMDGWMDE